MKFQVGDKVVFSDVFYEYVESHPSYSWFHGVEHLFERPLTICGYEEEYYLIYEDNKNFGYLPKWFDPYKGFELEEDLFYV